MNKKNVVANCVRHKDNGGITLIALVITIIVMLILVAVTITIAVNGGLFEYAGRAASETETKKEAEKDYTTLGENMSTDDLIDKYTTYGTTYTAYEVGDTVTVGGQSFYVIEASDETKSTVKLLAAKCVDTREKIEDVTNPNYNKQTDTTYTVAFDSTEPYSNVYADSTIKPLVDSYVASLGVTVKEGRLMTKKEVEDLGAFWDAEADYGGGMWDFSRCPEFVTVKEFWLGAPYEGSSGYAWAVYGDESKSIERHQHQG